MSIIPEPNAGGGGFGSLPEAIDQGNAQRPILPEETRPAGEQWDDDVALGIVLSDAWDTITYLQSKGHVPIGIENADDLVRAYVKPRQWADGKARANLSMHLTLQAVEKIMHALHMALFGQGKRRPFIIQPLGKTKPEAARANAALLDWAMKEAGVKEEMRISLKTALTYGFVVGCTGWESRKIRKKVYKKNEQGEMKGTMKSIDIELPNYECLDLKMVLVDPGLKRQDLQHGAKFVIKQFMTDAYGLADLRSNPKYKDIPSDDELANFLANKLEPTEDTLAADKRAVWREFQAKLESEQTSKDPMTQPLEILEYWSEDRVVTVLQRKLVIRNEENEFGKLPFHSCAFIDVIGSAWGFGVAKLLAGEQRLQQGVMNNTIDSMALVLNPVFQLLKGIGPGTQAIPVSPGRVITESGELKPLVVPDVSKAGMEMIESSDLRAMAKVGANGGDNMPNQAMRTAEGVNAFAGDVVQGLQYFLEIFIDLVYIPVLKEFISLMHDHFSIEQVNHILTVQEGKAYEGDIQDVYNADCDVDVIAGSNMMAKFAAAQLAPMIIQLVSSGPVVSQFETSAIKFNFVEFTSQTLDMMGWDVDDLIVPQTTLDMQRVQQRNQAMSTGAAQMALQHQKHSDDLENIDAKGSAQAGVATVRSLLKNHEMTSEQELENLQNPQSQQNEAQ
jgi:hypothetical protein